MHAPYDQPTYEAVLQLLHEDDIVLDIGAGDLRLARQMAGVVRKVYAVEVNSQVLERGLMFANALPTSLIPIYGDARSLEIPGDVTVGVLLMRHCTHFRLYLEKLRWVGARCLITNARWRMSVEQVDILAERTPFGDLRMGWYACLCGATGFHLGPAEQWSTEMDQIVQEVSECPQCIQDGNVRR